MLEYLQGKIGDKVGLTRAGMPREVYFEGTLTKIVGGAAVLTVDEGREIAVPIDKILLVGPPAAEAERSVAGFCRPVAGGEDGG
jgi:hypothetical protein